MEFIIKVNGLCYSNPESVVKHYSTKSTIYFVRRERDRIAVMRSRSLDHSMLLLWI